ncbi:MAG: allantoinase AllB [Ignavibacteriaceae bacterium]|nr:allantoinase AllB [Ignavibacteriaceae bacterium]
MKLNSLNNVFICKQNNSLQLVKIEFTNTFQKITPILSRTFQWREINSVSKRKRFIANLDLTSPSDDSNILDGNFLLLIPGGIDPHVHFDTPGFEFRDDFEHASSAAAWGGTTTIIDMPCTSLPPVTSLQNFKSKLKAVKNRSVIDFAFWGGVRGNDFENKNDVYKQVGQLSKIGVAGFKAYLISGMDTFTDLTFEQILETAKIIKENNMILAVHAEDKHRIVNRMNMFQQKNRNNWKAYCDSRDDMAEVLAIKTLIEIAKATDCRIHIVHLSSAKGLEQVRKAQHLGLKFTAETCPHYLYFTQQDFDNKNISNFLKTAPPVKKATDRKELWKGLSDGSLSFVTTDHAGCNPKREKASKNFWEVYGGIPGAEHRVPFLFSEGFLKGKLALQKTIELLSTSAAEFFNLSQKGKIQVGKDADFSLINLWTSDVVKSSNMHSKGNYTPFENIVFNARVEKTFLRGKVVMERKNNFIAKPGVGKFIRVRNEQ